MKEIKREKENQIILVSSVKTQELAPHQGIRQRVPYTTLQNAFT